ncbi:MAG: hypothetical protein ACYSW3_00115 [Planctomycetota bacterium]
MRVTKPLNRHYAGLSRISPDIIAAAQRRGNIVHDWVFKYLDQGFVPDPSMLTNEQPYIQSWLRWHKAMVQETVAIELHLKCDCWQYTGHLDWLGRLKGDSFLTVLDWKTPVIEQKIWACQCAAYWHLVDKHYESELPVKRLGSLKLSPVGKDAEMIEYTDRKSAHLAAFLSALSVERYFYGA